MSERPGCPFGVGVDARLRDLEGAYARLEGRINGLIGAILLAVIVEVWRTLTRG